MNQNSKNYKYNLKTILYTIFNFIKVKKASNANFKAYKDFCLNYPRVSDYSKALDEPIIVNSYEAHIKDLKWKEMSLTTFDKKDIKTLNLNLSGKNISCIYITNPNSNKWVVGMHGWTEDKYLALRLVFHYWQVGYNVLTFDSYAHGDTYGDNTDIGLSSLPIVEKVVDYIKVEFKASHIGLIGNSMGASSAVLYAQKANNKEMINWIVADCGFNDIKLQYRYYNQQNFAKQDWYKVCFAFIKKFSKITKSNQNKFNLMKKMKLAKEIPIFFIHSKKDTFVPCFMSEEMFVEKVIYEKKIISELWTPNSSGHVWIIADLNKDYVEKTIAFANKNEK
ncbi:alpha/beta hydrolase [Mesoplasma corruscae]|uniref:Hydrolase n=1 Tax=Mesoplasma corruscae TaxID=216874 RepID=A0A2S5REK0_9MOLU|nr:alpha/beta hydrolase [Mesoplasma corruscae]PPE05642.1 hydrolase [Mesoplasma corruscae]